MIVWRLSWRPRYRGALLVFEKRIPIPDRSLVAALGDAWKEVQQVRAAAAVPA